MAKPQHVLLFGHDALLMRSRGLILNKDGNAVDSVSKLAELKNCLIGKSYGLLVLCHSISPAERRAAIALVLSIQPELELLALDDGAPAPLKRPLVHLLPRDAGPEEFRRTAQLLLIVTDKPKQRAERSGMTQPEETARWFNHARGYGLLSRDRDRDQDSAGIQGLPAPRVRGREY